MVLVILLLRTLGKRFLPRTVFRALWIVAALRLLLPLSLALPVPMPAPATPLPAADAAATGQAWTWENTLPYFGAAQTDTHQPAAAVTPWTLLWLVGVVLLTAYFAVSYVRCLRTFQTSLPEHSPEVEAWLAEHRLTRRVCVRCSDQITSPLTYGIFRPVILLPKTLDRRDTATLQFVLTHEWVHVWRWDAMIKLLFAAVLALHWFNPMVWLLYWLGNRDLEFSCDAAVVRRMGREYRAAYALALLALEEKRSGLLPCFSRLSRNFLEERVKSIMQYKRASAVAVFLAMLLVVGITSAFALRPETTAQIQLHEPAAPENSVSGEAALGETQDGYTVASQWAEALKERDGKARYALLSADAKARYALLSADAKARYALLSADAKAPYYEALTAQNGTEYPWTIGVSSPWVVDYEIALDGAEAVITYRTETSDRETYIYQEALKLTEEHGRTVIQGYGVTVEYLREDLYEKALDIQAQVREGHLTWRLDPESVTLNFLYNTLGLERGTMRSATDQEAVFETKDGETIFVQLYRPLNVENGFLAVYEYTVENHHQIVDNLDIY